MKELFSIPVFELSEVRRHVQEVAKAQWLNLKPERAVCVGIPPFPTLSGNSKERADATIEWFKAMHELFDLNMPNTFIVTWPGGALTLISEDRATFSDS